jgi:DNA-binding winged helix-turn-helix (wHTH) protein
MRRSQSLSFLLTTVSSSSCGGVIYIYIYTSNRFVDCVLNTQLYTLQRAGQTMRLRPKVFEVCRYLLEHRDRVITKDELIEQVWPDQYISDTTLEATIKELRQALGDSGREQRIIQTLYRRGYRFVAAVEARSLSHFESATRAPDNQFD